MGMILEMFPGAKFVHIVRNPWEVYCSTRSHFARVFNAFAWQDFRDVDVPEYTLATYEKLMRRYLEDRDRLNLPESQFVETTFEAITANPQEEIGRIYNALGIDGKEVGLAEIDSYLESLGDYKRNVHHVNEAEADAIRERWGFSFDTWGYDKKLPDSVAVKSE
jgi:hypothetical protein